MRIDINVNVDIKELTVALFMEDAVSDAIKIASEALLTESNKTAPKDEGILIQSGKTDFDSMTNTGYVSYDTPYAIRLHEHPEYNFQNGRRGKWLELTMNEQRTMLANLIALKLRERVSTGGGGL